MAVASSNRSTSMAWFPTSVRHDQYHFSEAAEQGGEQGLVSVGEVALLSPRVGKCEREEDSLCATATNPGMVSQRNWKRYCSDIFYKKFRGSMNLLVSDALLCAFIDWFEAETTHSRIGTCRVTYTS